VAAKVQEFEQLTVNNASQTVTTPSDDNDDHKEGGDAEQEMTTRRSSFWFQEERDHASIYSAAKTSTAADLEHDADEDVGIAMVEATDIAHAEGTPEVEDEDMRSRASSLWFREERDYASIYSMATSRRGSSATTVQVENANYSSGTTNPLWVEAEELSEGGEHLWRDRGESYVLLSGDLVDEGIRILANELGDVGRHPQPRLLTILRFFCFEGHRCHLEAEGLCADELSIENHHLWGPRMASLEEKAVQDAAVVKDLQTRGIRVSDLIGDK
jgi:hypothetical protein